MSALRRDTPAQASERSSRRGTSRGAGGQRGGGLRGRAWDWRGWLIAGLPNPVLFGALMTFFALIPFLGTAFVWLPGGVYLLAVSDWTGGLILLGWGVLVVGTIGRVLKALFISGGGKIHFFVVFVGIVGGLAAWGILGLFIGPPVMSLFLFLLENYRITRKTRILHMEAHSGADLASSGAGVYDQEN